MERSVYELLIGKSSAEECISETGIQNFYLIKSNINLVGIEIEIVGHEKREFILQDKLQGIKDKFDFIFIDPPYDAIREYHQTLRDLGRGRLLTPSSLVIAEHSRHIILEEEYVSLRRRRTIRHGDAQLSFYRPS